MMSAPMIKAANTTSYIKLKKGDLGSAGFAPRHIAFINRMYDRSCIESKSSPCFLFPLVPSPFVCVD
jgi:hypothetical protein